MKRGFVLLFLFFSFPAHSESFSEPLCQFWLAHKPSAGVAYQPSIDVHGKHVVPADINAQMPGLLPSRITFPLTVDMAKQMNIPVPEGAKLDADMGKIDVYTDGRILYNGQDMSAAAQVLCTEKPVETVTKQPEPPPAAPPKEAPVNDDKDVIWGEGH